MANSVLPCLRLHIDTGTTSTPINEEATDEVPAPFYVVNVAKLVGQILGSSLSLGDWCIVTSPSSTKSHGSAKNCRHKKRNFASLVSARLADIFGIRFYEDVAACHSKHRVGAVFTFGKTPPTERNIIVFDDFVTSGATMISMKNLLELLCKKLVSFTGINNKL